MKLKCNSCGSTESFNVWVRVRQLITVDGNNKRLSLDDEYDLGWDGDHQCDECQSEDINIDYGDGNNI